MKSERDRGEDTGMGDASTKRPYRQPQLRRLGTVRELTLSSGTVNATEPVFNTSPKASP